MTGLRSAPPISWPSLSDLARRLYGEGRGLDTLGREVRRLGVKTRRIGRELRVEPRGAVRVLEARGVTIDRATEVVRRVVQARSREVPALNVKANATMSQAPADRYVGMGPRLTAAMQAYEQRMFGTPVMTLLPRQGPTDLKRIDDLLRAIGGSA